MFQQTPFGNFEECKYEFEKIFKGKTGNEWENKDSFIQVKKKYKLVKLVYRTVE